MANTFNNSRLSNPCSPQRTSFVPKSDVKQGFTGLNAEECALFDEKKENALEAQAAARKERENRIRERQEKAMAKMKNRM